MKNIISVLTIICLILSLASCGKSDFVEKSAVEKNAVENTVWYLGGNEILSSFDPKEIFADYKDTIDPQKIYNSLNYNEKMLYGSYVLEDEEKELKRIRKESKFVDTEFSDGTYNISVLPIAIYLGSDNLCGSDIGYAGAQYRDNIKDKELALLVFPTEDKTGKVYCSYEVKGNKLKFTELNQTSKGDEPFAYEIGKAVFEYDFSLSGIHISLSKGDESIKLTAYSFVGKNAEKLRLSGYSLVDSPLIDELDYFSVDTSVFNYAVKRDGSYYDRSAFMISDDGKITIYLADKDENGETVVFMKQYAYIFNCEPSDLLNYFKVVLLDGENTYYYTDSITNREARILAEDNDISNLSEDKIKEIAEKKADLFDELYKEFSEKGINVTINRATGEMAMDSSVLFGGDSAEITADGKELLNKFLDAYVSIVYSDKYEGFIAKTLVEGHTAPIAGSTYESGLPLSKERAENVMAYCLSANAGINFSKNANLLEAVGCSNSKPVYNNNGEIDLAASRRVSFRFIINIG